MVFGPRPMFRGRNKGLFIFLIILVLIIFLLIRGFIWVEHSLRPTFLAIAEARAKIIAFDAINRAINERVAQNILYEDLVDVEKDREGRITMARTNTMEVNRVQAQTVRRVQNTLKTIEGEKINIPLGQVLGSQILAAYGPGIPVTLIPIGTVHVNVSHSFSEAGINQTRHKIYLEVYADVQVIIPFVSTSREVKTAVPIADTLYMGDVPDTVVDLSIPFKDGEGFSDIQGSSSENHFGSQNNHSQEFSNDNNFGNNDDFGHSTNDEWVFDNNEWDSGSELRIFDQLPYFNR